MKFQDSQHSPPPWVLLRKGQQVMQALLLYVTEMRGSNTSSAAENSAFLVSVRYGFDYFLTIHLDSAPLPWLTLPQPVRTRPYSSPPQRRFLSLGAACPLLCGTQHNFYLCVCFFSAPLWAGCELLQSGYGSQWSKALCQHLVSIWQDVFEMNCPLDKCHPLNRCAQLWKKKIM